MNDQRLGRACCAQPAAMAATNKCLARSNKSRTRGNAKLLVGNLFDPISVFS